MEQFIFFAMILAMAGVGLIYFTITTPRRFKSAKMLEERDKVKIVDVPGGDALTASALDLGAMLGALFNGRADDETTVRASRIVQLLKSANWYWEPSVMNRPTPNAPFWSISTYYTAKAGYMLLYAAIAFVAGALLALALGYAIALPFAVVIGLFFGFIEPDARLTTAVRHRQDGMTIELGFAVPRLFAMVKSRPNIDDALRRLTDEPGGGPLIGELRRVMKSSDLTRSITAGMKTMIERNINPSVRRFATAMLMSSERTGGDVAAALDIQSDIARKDMTRYVIERSNANAANANEQVYTTMMILFLGGLVFPIAVLVAAALAGGGP